uniref:COP9 signalosome complex subunit 9 isoform X1 n=1 Tax=Halichoerus grypus TaxID=9711 RepID=UPI00165921B1|nr:COP9 signalosome complex subunit 9 isoform X1 [Halichoerus grypus]
MKPAVDEMFPEGAGPYVDLDEAGGSTGLLMDLAANEKAVHADFFNGGSWFSCLSCVLLGSSLLAPFTVTTSFPRPFL